ncbi:hypothetical protein N0V88_002190 [Collariella sp. IMI 366227]|nr:hypothetical protein N0V88_002190 [Collariella sp. IMI 366227]
MASAPNPELRRQVIAIYKRKLHRAFMSKANVTDEGEIRQGIARAEFVKKGMASAGSIPSV